MKQPSRRVAISGFHGLDNPEPGTPVARALRQGWRGAIEIDALTYDPLTTGAWMPGVADALHIVPSLKDGDDAVFARIMEIHKRRRLDALIPCLDLEIPVYARLADRLAREGIGTLLPSAENAYAIGKTRLAKFCHDHDIAAPKTIHVASLGDLPLHAQQFGFPLFIKSTVVGAKRVGDITRAISEADKFNKRWDGGVILQEVLAGEEFVVSAVAGRNGRCRAIVAMRKLGLNEKGKGVVGAVIDDPEIIDHAKAILEKLDWRGPLEMEFIRSPATKRLYLIEVNCRFPSWIMLAHWARCNLPVVLLQEILQPRTTRLAPARPGTTFVRDIDETAVPLERIRQLRRFGSCDGPAPTPPRRRNGLDADIRVAVSGIGTLDVVNAGLGAARALRAAPDIASIYGLGYGRFDSGLYRPELFDRAFSLPASDDPGVLLDRLKVIHHGSPFDVIIPCLDGEIPRFIEIRDELQAIGIKTLLPSSEAFERRTKTKLFTGRLRADWGGFEIPRAVRVSGEEDVERAVAKLGFPVVVKGPISHAVRARDGDEARDAWRYLRERGEREGLVQQLIEGDNFAVAAVCGRDHRVLTSLSIKKLRRCDRGSTWSALRAPQPALEESLAAFLAHIGWVGPVEGEFIRERNSERFFLIEINPRFTAWIGLSAPLGLNHPYAAVCTALDRPFEIPAGSDDLVFMRSCEDVLVSARDFAAIAMKGELLHG